MNTMKTGVKGNVEGYGLFKITFQTCTYIRKGKNNKERLLFLENITSYKGQQYKMTYVHGARTSYVQKRVSSLGINQQRYLGTTPKH